MRLSVLSDGQWFITVEPETISDKPIALMRAAGVKSSNASLSGVKSISYGESLLVVRKAQQLGFDDGILLNENGHIVETAFSNLLILTSDGWLTPDLKTGCLPGITRELLIKWFDVKEGLFTFEQLLTAKAVYVTSSIRLIQPVSKVEDQLFDESLIGIQLITQFSQRLFSNINP
jgi:branched-subunit amino acid aminotransferase/4-amino-4-deoxychorismate lyase